MKNWMVAIGALVLLTVIWAVVATRTTAPGTAPKAPVVGTDPPGTPTRTNAPVQAQPQGSTGPIETRSGGAPPASPQGEAPPGMQATPQEIPEKPAPHK